MTSIRTAKKARKEFTERFETNSLVMQFYQNQDLLPATQHKKTIETTFKDVVWELKKEVILWKNPALQAQLDAHENPVNDSQLAYDAKLKFDAYMQHSNLKKLNHFRR